MRIRLAIRLALPCAGAVLLAAGCGGGGASTQPMVNYGSLANAICGKFTAEASAATSSGARLQAIDKALNGLEGLVPPNSVRSLYLDLVAKFKLADELLKSNMGPLAKLAARLRSHPGDKVAARKYKALANPISQALQRAAADAHTLGLGRCEFAFGGG